MKDQLMRLETLMEHVIFSSPTNLFPEGRQHFTNRNNYVPLTAQNILMHMIPIDHIKK